MRACARVSDAGRAALLASAMLAACTALPASAEPLCAAGPVRVSVDFPGGGRHACLEAERGRIVLSVTPEAAPINPSPWYAFRLDADAPTRVRVTLAYEGADHRYHPKWSSDGRAWNAIASRNLSVDDAHDRATLTLALRAGATYIAAQPIETPEAILAWARGALAPAGFTEVEYGRSIDARPLIAFRGGGEAGDGLVVALARQHPPETTGAAAFRAFAERIGADTPEARAFRARHRVLLAPMPNPDGVVRGHWRLNAGGMDLNRDWGRFTQPETRALGALIEREAAGRRMAAFFDFHSTDRTVIYAPPLDSASPAIAFLPFLRARAEAQLAAAPAWSYGHNAEGGTSKAWALVRFGAPGLTIELADASSPMEARRLGEATADALVSYFASP